MGERSFLASFSLNTRIHGESKARSFRDAAGGASSCTGGKVETSLGFDGFIKEFSGDERL
jgi:hypothetical protein